MGNLKTKRKAINPGSALDRVISQASSDDCVLYRLADYKKGGRLLEEYMRGGGKEVERLILEEFGVFMYNNGKGMQITRTEYLKWKYSSAQKDQISLNMDTKSPFDPLKKWQDHEACWQMTFRGSLGESLLHVLIMCDTKAHTRIAKILLKCFPKLALDVVEGEEYLGASALHLAIAYTNNDLVNILVACGANINQRAIGSFFLPKDQQVTCPPGPECTEYEGLAYLGEYPLAWSACLGNETVYNRLLDHGASPNLQDNFGNMILHMVVVCNQLGMFSYALRHPRLPAQDGIVNAANLTPLTLACKLARSTIFREMLELTCIEFWRYSNITCSAYPLNALDTIKPSGETNWNSALMIILNGTKSEHLDMLEGGIIQRLLEEKWKTFARNQFLKRLGIMLLQLITMSVIIYLRPCYCGPKGMHLEDPSIRKMLWDEFFAVDAQSIVRYCFEVIVLIEVIFYLIVQQGDEILNQGFSSFMKGLAGDPPKSIFVVSNILFLLCVPCRISYFFSKDLEIGARSMEDELLAYSAAGSWFMMLFFAGALKLTGPFVVMIYKMISGDMFTFSIIYGIMLLGFTQAFFFLYKRSEVPDKDSKFVSYRSTWMALFHMTLGEYDYGGMNQNIYSAMTKFVFLVFTIMLPIMLLNMLIAMMGNTYSTVISMSEKEWVKAWAKIVIALERAVSQEKLKEYLYVYSVPLGGGQDGEEHLGVMVIKSANKTKAKQRKGALSNWKRVGRVTIDALKKRGVSGEYLRREMWGLQTAASTPVKGPMKKGGLAAYNVKAGKAGAVNPLDDELEAGMWPTDEPQFFDEDAHDGLGALTGAIDQLAFTSEFDAGDGDKNCDETVTSRRPELATAEVAAYGLDLSGKDGGGKSGGGKKKKAFDNPAFIDDEELLLAASISQEGQGHDDDDSDDDLAGPNRPPKTPKIIVRNDLYDVIPKAPDKGAPPKGGVTLPPLVNAKHRPSSVKLRRLGSARRRKVPCYGIAFAEPPSSRGKAATPAKAAMPAAPPAPVSPAAPYANGSIPSAKDTPIPPSKELPPSSTPKKPAVTEGDSKKLETPKKDSTKGSGRRRPPKTKSDSADEPKWAERKKKNKVVPTSVSVDADTKSHKSQEEGSSSGGGEDGGETLKPGGTSPPKDKMRSWSTDNVADMKSILPWENEED